MRARVGTGVGSSVSEYALGLGKSSLSEAGLAHVRVPEDFEGP